MIVRVKVARAVRQGERVRVNLRGELLPAKAHGRYIGQALKTAQIGDMVEVVLARHVAKARG